MLQEYDADEVKKVFETGKFDILKKEEDSSCRWLLMEFLVHLGIILAGTVF